MTDITPIFIPATVTAKLVKQALKRAFPQTRFSVRCSHYSMGTAITVAWDGGPTSLDVRPHVENFEGAGFDAMTDSRVPYTHWLAPDGEAVRNDGQFTPESTCLLVQFGCDKIRLHRQ